MALKRYLLFAGDHYYPKGGWDDFRDSFDTIEAAMNAGEALLKAAPGCDWAHILDTETMRRVYIS